jgi:hypothetical protein
VSGYDVGHSAIVGRSAGGRNAWCARAPEARGRVFDRRPPDSRTRVPAVSAVSASTKQDRKPVTAQRKATKGEDMQGEFLDIPAIPENLLVLVSALARSRSLLSRVVGLLAEHGPQAGGSAYGPGVSEAGQLVEPLTARDLLPEQIAAHAVECGQTRLPEQLLGTRADDTLRNLVRYLDPNPDPVRHTLTAEPNAGESGSLLHGA